MNSIYKETLKHVLEIANQQEEQKKQKLKKYLEEKLQELASNPPEDLDPEKIYVGLSSEPIFDLAHKDIELVVNSLGFTKKEVYAMQEDNVFWVYLVPIRPLNGLAKTLFSEQVNPNITKACSEIYSLLENGEFQVKKLFFPEEYRVTFDVRTPLTPEAKKIVLENIKKDFPNVEVSGNHWAIYFKEYMN